MIRLRGLRKSYGNITAVDGVSLEIARGEAFGLLGPNGAGKTTTLSMIVGLIAPDAGTVEVGGADPLLPATRRRIGICPQSVSLYPELTGRQNLSFFARLQGLSGRDLRARVGWALDFAGLTDRADTRVSTYSGGMQRRLNLAAGMVHDPEVLLCDEPTVGVDPQSRNHLYERIERLRDEGRTILYTTHYMEEAQRLCNRVAILDHGAVLALGSPDELIAAHGGTATVTARARRTAAARGSTYPASHRRTVAALREHRAARRRGEAGRAGPALRRAQHPAARPRERVPRAHRAAAARRLKAGKQETRGARNPCATPS